MITSSQIKTAFIVFMSQDSIFTWYFCATGRTSKFATKPTTSKATIRWKIELYACSGGIDFLFATESRSINCGPITAAIDHAVISRPWIAPTW